MLRQEAKGLGHRTWGLSSKKSSIWIQQVQKSLVGKRTFLLDSFTPLKEIPNGTQDCSCGRAGGCDESNKGGILDADEPPCVFVFCPWNRETFECQLRSKGLFTTCPTRGEGGRKWNFKKYEPYRQLIKCPLCPLPDIYLSCSHSRLEWKTLTCK